MEGISICCGCGYDGLRCVCEEKEDQWVLGYEQGFRATLPQIKRQHEAIQTALRACVDEDWDFVRATLTEALSPPDVDVVA